VDTLANKPDRSAIGVTLSWPAPTGASVRRYRDVPLLALWLCGWAVGGVLMADQFADGGPRPAHPRVSPTFAFWSLVALLGLWAMFGGMALWNLWTYFRPARPVSVRLEAEALRHDPGRSPFYPPQQRWWDWGRLAGPRPAQVARSDIRGFALERDGERQRLYLDRGTDRLEIGAGLREPDREWLFAVLQEWHTPNHPLQQTGAAVLVPGSS
jgi:hypothetical protein